MFFGAIFWAFLADVWGRKSVVIWTTFLAGVAGFAAGLSPDIYVLLVTRFFVGFALGGSGAAYTLFAEYAPKSFRGNALMIEQGFWSGGALFSVATAWVTLKTLDWRWYMI